MPTWAIEMILCLVNKFSCTFYGDYWLLPRTYKFNVLCTSTSSMTLVSYKATAANEGYSDQPFVYNEAAAYNEVIVSYLAIDKVMIERKALHDRLK